jgi:hypothetical protein
VVWPIRFRIRWFSGEGRNYSLSLGISWHCIKSHRNTNLGFWVRAGFSSSSSFNQTSRFLHSGRFLIINRQLPLIGGIFAMLPSFGTVLPPSSVAWICEICWIFRLNQLLFFTIEYMFGLIHTSYRFWIARFQRQSTLNELDCKIFRLLSSSSSFNDRFNSGNPDFLKFCVLTWGFCINLKLLSKF